MDPRVASTRLPSRARPSRLLALALALLLVLATAPPARATSFAVLLGGETSQEETCPEATPYSISLWALAIILGVFLIDMEVVLSKGRDSTRQLVSARGPQGEVLTVTAVAEGRYRVSGALAGAPATLEGAVVELQFQNTAPAGGDEAVIVRPVGGQTSIFLDEAGQPIPLDNTISVLDLVCDSPDAPTGGVLLPGEGNVLCGDVQLLAAGWNPPPGGTGGTGPLSYAFSVREGLVGASGNWRTLQSSASPVHLLDTADLDQGVPRWLRLQVTSGVETATVIQEFIADCAAPTVTGEVQPDGDYRQVIPVSVAAALNTAVALDPLSGRRVEVSLPGAALNADTTLEVIVGSLADERVLLGDPTFGGDDPTRGTLVSLVLGNGQTELLADVQVCFTHPDEDGDLQPDDIPEAVGELCLGYYDEATGEWVCEDRALVASAGDEDENGKVCGDVPHFTLFALMVDPFASVGGWEQLEP